MANDESNDKPARSFAPGTLDKTRKAIGPVDAYEAQRMAGILGGEVLPERSEPINYDLFPKSKKVINTRVKATGLSSADISAKSASLSATSNSYTQSANVNQIANNSGRRIKTEEELPALTARDLKAMDKLMRSTEYAIKPNYGLFNFFLTLSPKSREKVTKEFGEYTIKKHLEHMQTFIGTIKTFIQISPDTYKSKIAADPELKFKFLRTVGRWTTKDLKTIALDLENKTDELTVSMLIPFVRTMYQMLLTVYYIGEQQVPAMIKEVYADLLNYPDADKTKLQGLAKEAITEWLYVYNQIMKGMYPLLMRMCSPVFEPFPQFFTSQISIILGFVRLTKFDLLLPGKKKKTEEQIKAEKEEQAKKEEENRHVPGKKDELVNTGLKLLDKMFPEAGFTHLDDHPDMYPYFQPLYNFPDGFNLLSPQNGIQVTVVLLRIIEDLFQGCQKIKFNLTGDEKIAAYSDNLENVMNEWVDYREDYFNRKYCDYLKSFVNSVYTQSDFAKSQYGKESISNMLWQTKYYFLPFFEFTQILLEKPVNDNKHKPLWHRTDYLREIFTLLVKRIDENSASKAAVLGITNPWEPYNFEIPNVISKRLDVLLGAKRPNGNATNANLLKYTLCIVAVLDWWINNKQSPAYSTDSSTIYRISEEDGGPQFSVPVREDQNQLFAAAIKKAIAAKSAGK